MKEVKKDGGTAMKGRKMAMIHFFESGENIAVIASLRQDGNSIEKTAKILGISENTLLAYAKESDKIRRALTVGKMQALGIAKQSLMNHVKQGNLDAIKHWLKYNNKSIYGGGTGMKSEFVRTDDGFFEAWAQVNGYEIDTKE